MNPIGHREDSIASSSKHIRIRREKRIKISKKRRRRKPKIKIENEANDQPEPTNSHTNISIEEKKTINANENPSDSTETRDIFEKIFVPRPRSRSPAKKYVSTKETDIETLDAMAGDKYSHGDGPYQISRPSISQRACSTENKVFLILIIVVIGVFVYSISTDSGQNEIQFGINTEGCNQNSCDSRNSFCVILEHGSTCRCLPGT